jgi:EmrB/QacA subfamily drug resistance transporter
MTEQNPTRDFPLGNLVSAEGAHHERRWAILGILGIAQLMVVLDSTIVNIALPSAQHALHFSNSERQWIITAYALAFGSLLLLGGKISDLFGRKWTFIGGLAGFAIASAVGGASQSFAMLAASRTAQGAFGALLAPAALSLLTTTFSNGPERNKAFGIYSAIAGSGASIGLLIGGILTQTLTWRYCMYVNLIFAVIAISGATRLLHNVRPTVRPKVDVPGVLTVTAGLFGIVFGFSHAQTSGWGNPLTVAMLVIGVGLLGAFALLQARGDHPLLPLRVLTDRNRGASYLAILISGAAMFGVFLFLTYYMQQSRGYSPITTGLAFLPMTAVIMGTAVLSTTRLRNRFGPRNLVVLGMLLGAAGMLWLTRLSLTSSYLGGILPTLVMMGIGLGMVFSSGMFGATLGVLPSDAGVASATVTASQQVGGSLGTSLLSTLAASAGTSFVSSHLIGGHPTAAVVARAAVHGYTTGFAVSAGIFAVGAVVSAVLFERGVPQVAAAAEPDAGNASELQLTTAPEPVLAQ